MNNYKELVKKIIFSVLKNDFSSEIDILFEKEKFDLQKLNQQAKDYKFQLSENNISKSNNELTVDIVDSISKKIKSKIVNNFTKLNEKNIDLINHNDLYESSIKNINKVLNSFMLKHELEINTIEDNIIIFYLLEKISSELKILDFISNISFQLENIVNDLNSWILQTQLEWYSKKFLKSDLLTSATISLLFDEQTHLLTIITSAIIRSIETLANGQVINRLSETIENLNELLLQKVGSFHTYVYGLLSSGKQHVNKLLIDKNENKETIDSFWKNHTLTKIVTGYGKFFTDYEEEMYEKLFLIYIGYSIQKSVKSNFEKYFQEFISSKNNIPLDTYSKMINSNKYSEWIFELFKNNKNELQNLDYITIDYKTLSNYELQKKGNELHEHFKNEGISQWFFKGLNEFLKENGIPVQFSPSNPLWDINWSAIVYTIFKNRKLIEKPELDVLFYSYLKFDDFKKISNFQKMNFASIPEELLIKKENECWIKTKINQDKSIEHIRNIYGNYLDEEELIKIDPISLVDNSLLSAVDCHKFSYFEFTGDLIYNIIMHDLMLDGKLKIGENFSEMYKDAKTQNKICESLKFAENIQEGTIYHFRKKPIIPADYFETFIYNIYRLKGYQEIKKIVFELIKENNKDILNNDKVIEIIEKEYKISKNQNIFSDFSHITKLDKLIIYLFKNSDEFKKIPSQKISLWLEAYPINFLTSYIKLILLVNPELSINRYNSPIVNKQFSFNEILNTESQSIYLSLLEKSFATTIQDIINPVWNVETQIKTNNMKFVFFRWIDLFNSDYESFDKKLKSAVKIIIDEMEKFHNLS